MYEGRTLEDVYFWQCLQMVLKGMTCNEQHLYLFLLLKQSPVSECFLTGDGKGMKGANFKKGKLCWLCADVSRLQPIDHAFVLLCIFMICFHDVHLVAQHCLLFV